MWEYMVSAFQQVVDLINIKYEIYFYLNTKQRNKNQVNTVI